MSREILINDPSTAGIAVVIPCYKVTKHILEVIKNIPEIVGRIYVIDDACPDFTGKYVEDSINDDRVKVIYHKKNLGVGGAVMTGYQMAIEDKVEVVVKVDGDGQMDPRLIPFFIKPILMGEADYTKGNRFYDLEGIRAMPPLRLFGNAVLSFMTKLSSGYWNLFDPTNGYTAIHVDVAMHLPFKKISRRYFFETDMLFRLNTLRAVVVDIPMDAAYGDEVSNLKISKIVGEFFIKHMRNFTKRVFYNYYLRDMSLASLELPAGLLMLSFGVIFGGYQWFSSWQTGSLASAGSVMLSGMPIITGIQFVLAFFAYDINSVPKRTLHRKK